MRESESNQREKLRVGILGATGMVGQKFITLLIDHPFLAIEAVAASEKSAGKTYRDAVEGRWYNKNIPIPAEIGKLTIHQANNTDAMRSHVDFVFSALDMNAHAIRTLEESYAALGIPVISNNSAHRWTEDVPILLPEVNPSHADMINFQQKNRGWEKGFIAVKPNCSVQSFVPAIHALKEFEPERVRVTTFQAVSGAGKTLETWPEMTDNVIPFIAGEEEKTREEPKKIWARIEDGKFVLAETPTIDATCVRAPVSDGHMAVANIKFKKQVGRESIIAAFRDFKNPLTDTGLPSAPEPFLIYSDEPDRPQTRLDRDNGKGMAITIGRLKQEQDKSWTFVALSHNTVRGAAGGAILMAEFLKAKGYL